MSTVELVVALAGVVLPVIGWIWRNQMAAMAEAIREVRASVAEEHDARHAHELEDARVATTVAALTSDLAEIKGDIGTIRKSIHEVRGFMQTLALGLAAKGVQIPKTSPRGDD